MEDKHENQKQRTTRVHIDEKQYESPNPTTGEALYVLGHVKDGLVLYREVTGDREDRELEKDSEAIHLQQDEHFHSGPQEPVEIHIIVNAQPKVVTARKQSFEQIVALAFNPVPPHARFTVMYSRGFHDKHGFMKPGEIIRVKNKMVFNVTETGES